MVVVTMLQMYCLVKFLTKELTGKASFNYYKLDCEKVELITEIVRERIRESGVGSH